MDAISATISKQTLSFESPLLYNSFVSTILLFSSVMLDPLINDNFD